MYLKRSLNISIWDLVFDINHKEEIDILIIYLSIMQTSSQIVENTHI